MSSPERLFITLEEGPRNENEEKHIARYIFASMFAKGDILDLACGSGYGSMVLSTKGRVTGVDASGEAIYYARTHNANPKIEYIHSCAEEFVPTKRFDSIVCLETFEHLDSIHGFDLLLDFEEWLTPKGQLVFSTPMLRYKDGKPYVTNPYHVNEMPREEFLRLINFTFRKMKLFFFHQDINTFNVLGDENTGFLITVGRKV